MHKDAIETARCVGVDTVIYSSMMLGGETGLDSLISIQQGHIHIMRYLGQSGIGHIIVQQGIYAEGWPHYGVSAARAIGRATPGRSNGRCRGTSPSPGPAGTSSAKATRRSPPTTGTTSGKHSA
ncbi:hypothetical protein ABZ461_37315 [Actinacidiphila glaucinigra]|uniref:hypothetical protein n=1 Tax=Actinacidiphila glaucinigra TaxID=235986 RepID=UPI0033E0E7CA